MADTSKTDDHFCRVLREALQRRMDEIMEEEIQAAKERVTKRCKEQLPNILCSVQKRFSMERWGEDIRITVSMEDNQRGN